MTCQIPGASLARRCWHNCYAAWVDSAHMCQATPGGTWTANPSTLERRPSCVGAWSYPGAAGAWRRVCGRRHRHTADAGFLRFACPGDWLYVFHPRKTLPYQ